MSAAQAALSEPGAVATGSERALESQRDCLARSLPLPVLTQLRKRLHCEFEYLAPNIPA